MEQELACLRCGETMKFMRREKIQLGQTGFVFGSLTNLAAGSLEVKLFCCPRCDKLEFFLVNKSVTRRE